MRAWLRHQFRRFPRVVHIQVDRPRRLQCLSQRALEARPEDAAIDDRQGDTGAIQAVVLEGLELEFPPNIGGIADGLAGAAGRRTWLYVLPQPADERVGVDGILFSFLNEKFRHAIPARSHRSAHQECFRLCRVQKCLPVSTTSVSSTLSDRNCSK